MSHRESCEARLSGLGCDQSWARARDARTGAVKEFVLGYKVIKVHILFPYGRILTSPSSMHGNRTSDGV